MTTPTTETVETATPAATEPPAKNWSLLASTAFGDNYHGEVTEAPAPSPATQEVTQETAPTTEVVAEVVEQTETNADEKPISSMSELVSHYELDPEWINTLEVPVKVNGVESKATLADLTKNYQITQAAEQRLAEAKEKAKQETAAIAAKRETLNSQFATVAALIDQAEKTLTRDNANIDWQKLREQDPAEFSAKRQEMAERLAQINQLKQQAVGSYQNTQAMTRQEAEAQMQQQLQQESELLISKLPEWKDPEVAATEKQTLAKYLRDEGFSADDISAATDHRMIVMARKAMLFDKGQNKAELAKKKVTLIPKVAKPGTPKSPDQVGKAKADEARARLRSTGSLDDALALMRSRRG